MADVHRELNWKLAIVFAAFGAGFVAVVLGVAVLQSSTVVGISLAGMTVVVVYAWLTFRCPLCGSSVFNAPARAALRWVLRTPRRCPRCRTDYEAALQEVQRSGSR